jgi:hypothetical protein
VKRPTFIAGLGGAVAWLSTVRTQATGRPPLVAFIWLYSENQEAPRSLFRELLKGLQQLGDIESRDFGIIHRGAGGDPNTLPKVASEVVELNPDVIETRAPP